jgi:hypothetical protein
MSGLLGTGHPVIPVGNFDFTPLLYTALLLFALRRARIRLRPWVIPVAIVVGGVVDSISDAAGISTATAAAFLIGVAVVVSWRRTSPAPPPPTV